MGAILRGCNPTVTQIYIAYQMKNCSPIKNTGELLKNTNLRIYEIADKLCYRDLNYFNRIFKVATGVTPTEYRDLTVAS